MPGWGFGCIVSAMATVSYVIYVHATPDEVWRALLEPAFTRRYWFHEQVSDWQPGSPWSHRQLDDAGTVDIEGTVLEVDRPHRLAMTWKLPGATRDEEESTVTFSLEAVEEWPHGPWTGLQLEHTELEDDSEMFHSVAFGWPAVLSGLKSVLEAPGIFDG